VRILTRYILRSQVGPFLFALITLTSLLLINTVARKLEDLVGKGLPWSVLFEFLELSIPHILALTLPMAVLVAVLYSFSQLTADNEITALKASGVNLLSFLVPLLFVAAIIASIMVWFNDRVLPESNHRLKNLITDIGRKSPTFQLKEQAINEIATGDMRSRYFLQAGTVTPGTNALKDVVIYDLSNTARARTVYADRGVMAFNPAHTDLFLTLHDGWIHEQETITPERFQRVFFHDFFLRIRGVGNKLERSTDSFRSDREMNIAMLQKEVSKAREELSDIERESLRREHQQIKQTLSGTKARPLPPSAGLIPLDARGVPLPEVTARPNLLSGPAYDELVRQNALEARVLKTRAESVRDRVNQYSTELQKKFSIPFACLVFVLIGAPLAVRFPRGGVGMVIAISLGIFGIYYVSLIGGESLSDKGVLAPFWGMWGANLMFMTLSLFGLARLGHESTTTRGGGFDELLYNVHRFFGRFGAGRVADLPPSRGPDFPASPNPDVPAPSNPDVPGSPNPDVPPPPKPDVPAPHDPDVPASPNPDVPEAANDVRASANSDVAHSPTRPLRRGRRRR
jgi:lipopolysaccharide export system permease protein